MVKLLEVHTSTRVLIFKWFRLSVVWGCKQLAQKWGTILWGGQIINEFSVKISLPNEKRKRTVNEKGFNNSYLT